MQKSILEKLKAYIPGANHLYVEIVQPEPDSFEFIDSENEQILASVLFRGEDIEDFTVYFDEEEDIGSVSKDEMVNAATSFLTDFYPEEFRQSLFLSAIINLEDFYMIAFNRKDEQYSLELPNSGVNFSILPNGVITNVEGCKNTYKLEGAEPAVSAAEAKQLFLNELKLCPVIAKFEVGTFVNADNGYHFVYEIEDYVLDVSTDGSLHTIDMYGAARESYLSAQTDALPSDIYTLAGMAADHMKIAELRMEDGRLEIWSEQTKEELNTDDAMLTDLDIPIPGVVKLLFNYQGRLLYLLSDEAEEGNRSITLGKAKEEAMSLMLTVFSGEAQSFKLLNEPLDMDDVEQPISYRFTFQRFVKGIKVQNAIIAVEVSAFTGNMIRVEIDPQVFIDFSYLDLNAEISEETAKKIYSDALVMELAWSKEVDKEQYYLSYLASFPQTIGHIRAIDAKTGEPWVIDTSSLDEF